MKRIILLAFFAVVVISTHAQGNFRYATMKNNIWGKWETSFHNSYVIDHIGDGDNIIYYKINHPSDYIFRVVCPAMHYDNDKKSRKEHLKNDEWYEFHGVVEIFTDPETFVSRFPYVASHDKPEIKSNVLPAIIRIAPYKKRIETVNIFFGDVGLGLWF